MNKNYYKNNKNKKLGNKNKSINYWKLVWNMLGKKNKINNKTNRQKNKMIKFCRIR